MRSPKEVIAQALRREAVEAADNVARARLAFKGKPMDEKYGASDMTRADILSGYEERSLEVQGAISSLGEQAAASPSAVAEWIRGQVDPLLKKGWLTADGANELIAQARQKDILSSQAPKPASAGGEPVVSGWVNVYSDGSFGHLHEHESLARSQERGKGITIARTVFVSSAFSSQAPKPAEQFHKLDPRDEAIAGLYEKFRVARTDGSSEPGGKHEHCDYFVLDLTHDKHAFGAIHAYAMTCRDEYPALANDLLDIAREMAQSGKVPK